MKTKWYCSYYAVYTPLGWGNKPNCKWVEPILCVVKLVLEDLGGENPQKTEQFFWDHPPSPELCRDYAIYSWETVTVFAAILVWNFMTKWKMEFLEKKRM